MPVISKREADHRDRLIDAAGNIADLLESSGIELDELVMEDFCLFLASNAVQIKEIFKGLKISF